MTKKWLVFLGVVLGIILVFGIGQFSVPREEAADDQCGENESNNNVTGGFAGRYRGKIYYSDNGAFYETDTEFKEHKKLADMEISNLIFIEDKLFCSKYLPPFYMYSIDLKTGETQKIGNYEPPEMQRIGDYLYFTKFRDNPPLSIYRYSLKEGTAEKIKATEAEYLMVFQGVLHYAKWGLYGRVMYLAEDGEETIYSSDAIINVITSDEKNIYYSWDGVYRINEDKTVAKLSDVVTGFINIYQDEIYYTGSEGFFKMDSEGQNIVQLSAEKNLARFAVLDKDLIIAKKLPQTEQEETVLIRKKDGGSYETVRLEELRK